MKTSIRETLRIQPISMDELIGTLMSYEVEHLNEESNSKGKKFIAFKDGNDNVGGETSSKDEDEDDMALFTKKFKKFMKKDGNYQGRRHTRFS